MNPVPALHYHLYLLDVISECSFQPSNMNERSRSQGSVGRSAPVWVPDTASSTCQECRVRFSFVVRKHHCRACGRLLCARCSQHQAALHYLGGTLGRVCQPCHREIQNNKSKPRNMRRTKSLNDFDKMKENISKLIRSQQLAQAESVDQDTDGTSFISVLPLELLSKILEFLPFEDIKQCRFVCRFWLSAVSLSHFVEKSQVNLPDWVEQKVETLRTVTAQTSFKHFKLHNFPFDGNNIPLTSPSILILKDCEVTQRF